MTKQELVEARIDRNSRVKGMGKDLNALLAVQARTSFAKRKANNFIIEFSKRLGFTNHLDTASCILEYLYPKNRAFWETYDKMYSDQVDNSVWLNLTEVLK